LTTCSRAGGCAGSRYPFLTLKERDIETGLDYFLARFYSSTQGRFTSADEFTGGPDELYYFADDASANPTFYADLRNPQSLNKYQYSYNNPLRYVDPDGHDPQDPCGCKGPTDAQIIEDTFWVLDKIADATKITALAETIRSGASTALKEAKRAFEKYGDRVAPCNDCVYIYQNSNNSEAQPQQGQSQQKGLTEEKKKNLADAEKKGIPKDQLGPSGKPKVKVVKHSTEKRAKDAARNAGQRKPAKDVNPKKGGDHYHPTNKDGTRKKGKQNVHHEFPSD